MKPEQVKAVLESPIARAFAEGKVIEFYKNNCAWIDLESLELVHLAINPDRYRIKPEPRKFWLCDGIVYTTKESAYENSVVLGENGNMGVIPVIEVL